MKYGLSLPNGGAWGDARTLAEAGANWWLEYIPPDMGGLDYVRAHIQQGPLRINSTST